jgi:hypothetical protein
MSDPDSNLCGNHESFDTNLTCPGCHLRLPVLAENLITR